MMLYAIITGIILAVVFIAAALVVGAGAALKERQKRHDTHDPRDAHEARAETAKKNT